MSVNGCMVVALDQHDNVVVQRMSYLQGWTDASLEQCKPCGNNGKS